MLRAVVNDAVALVAHDMRARQIEVTVKLPAISCVISGDPVLLQQVLVNLMMNAMDAMAETPPDRRHITISSEVRRADVEVSVRDTGPGLPRISSAGCSRRSSRRSRMGSESASRSPEPLSRRTRAASVPTTIRTAARYSRSSCVLPRRTRVCLHRPPSRVLVGESLEV